jgi:hypothetical protein
MDRHHPLTRNPARQRSRLRSSPGIQRDRGSTTQHTPDFVMVAVANEVHHAHQPKSLHGSIRIT